MIPNKDIIRKILVDVITWHLVAKVAWPERDRVKGYKLGTGSFYYKGFFLIQNIPYVHTKQCYTTQRKVYYHLCFLRKASQEKE
jgi:hypothetical protein